jgi:signal transduction histidine kinase
MGSQGPTKNVVIFPPKGELLHEKVQQNPPTHYDLSPIVNALADGVMILDASGRIVWANHYAEVLFSPEDSTEDLFNIPFYTLFAPESRGVVHQHFASLRAGTVPSLFHSGQCVTAQNKQDQCFPLRMTLGVLSKAPELFFLILRAESHEPRAFCSEVDSTERLHNAETQGIESDSARINLRATRSKRQPRSKGEDQDLQEEGLSLLAHVTHEMRTPLVSIVGFSEMLLTDRLSSPERAKEYMTHIYKASQHVLALVNEILEVQHSQNGSTSLPFTVLNLTSLMRECVGLMSPQAFENHITLRMESTEEVEIYGHGRGLRQIFLNLLSNAVKFTDPGGMIILSCERMKGERVRVCCRDTGIGMTTAQIDSVLKGQVQSTWKERRGGMGFGLMLTQKLVADHKGHFAIRSQKPGGTRVEIIFPTRVADLGLTLVDARLLPV